MKPDDLIQVETMSETSEATTTTSLSGQHGFESREELLELVETLQLSSLEELYRERFRVDRRKLEHMLIGDDETPESASIFFRKIMGETNTVITWPTRLKIGAKSKKDPHIKVAGRVDDVGSAKEKIMQILDTRQSMRVTMKLDVSYTDHSHIIGKGGLTIKRVMEETSCHIHFPDSNRSNHQEKSNQVSIAGEMEGVEKARARVRNLTPLIFSFELPMMGAMHNLPDSTSPYIVKIQEKYNVQVMFRTRPKLHATLVVVKGCEWEVLQVKEATVFLIHHMCKNLANQIQIQMSMEISPQHHSIVLGKNSANLKQIMHRTATQIIFPDAGDPNIPSLKKSNVIITGAINNVYLARQQLLGSLPLVLMFDLPETSRTSLDTETISQLMQSLDVFINILHKPKQSSLSVIIKGVERNASNIYEARRSLLNLEDPRITADIPVTYNIPSNLFQPHLQEKFSNFLSMNIPSPSPYPTSPLPQSPWGLQSMFSPLMHHPFAFPNANTQAFLAARQAIQAGLFNQSHTLGTLPSGARNYPPGFGPAYLGPPGGIPKESKESYLSLSSASSSLSSPAVSPRNISPIGSSGASSSILSDLSGGETKEKRFGGLTAFDYEQKKILAMKAMRNKPNPSEFRVPNSTWAGYGLSQTVGSAGEGRREELWEDLGILGKFEEECRTPIAMGSTFLDGTPRGRLENILNGSHSELASAMISGGLDKKWIDMLISHEIDMSTFVSLTEEDLMDIGVTAWGARRKMMLLIAELKKRTKPFSGSAAPGAERRSSLPIPPVANTVEGKW